jgi:electron transfer flavoprotein beta subunit
MNIIVAFKTVLDDQDIIINSDNILDASKAAQIISIYDLNAIEAAVRLAKSDADSRVIGISVGPAKAADSKLRKAVLSRGIDELILVADDVCTDYDAHQSAAALKRLVDGISAWDLIICGDGSADNYAQQTDVQLAAALGLPFVNAVQSVTAFEGYLHAQRKLEDVYELVEITLPALISVIPDIALPRIPGMKDILGAGKKPARIADAGSFGIDEAAKVATLDIRAPKQALRHQEIIDFASDSSRAVSAFMAALR